MNPTRSAGVQSGMLCARRLPSVSIVMLLGLAAGCAREPLPAVGDPPTFAELVERDLLEDLAARLRPFAGDDPVPCSVPGEKRHMRLTDRLDGAVEGWLTCGRAAIASGRSFVAVFRYSTEDWVASGVAGSPPGEFHVFVYRATLDTGAPASGTFAVERCDAPAPADRFEWIVACANGTSATGHPPFTMPRR